MGDLRDCHGGVGKVVCAGYTQAFGRLLGGRDAVVLDVAVFEIGVESFEIDEVRDVRVGGGTMVTFVKVVGEDLPVEITFDLVGVVELVIVEIKLAVPFLLVDVVEMFFPGYFWGLFGVHVDPDEAVDVDFDVDAKETVLLLLIPLQVLIARSFGEFSIQAVRPAVVSASEDLRVAFLLLHDRVSTMSTDVVEGIDVSSTVSVDDDIVSCNVEAKEVSSVLDT